MKNSQAALLAILNVITCGAAAAVVAGMELEWKEWWHPLLGIAAACAIVSSIYLWFVERQLEEETPERSKIAWAGNILFLVAVGFGVAVAYVNGAFGNA